MEVKITRKPTEEYELIFNGLKFEVRVERSEVLKGRLFRLLIKDLGTGRKYEIPSEILEAIDVLKQHNII